MVTPFILLFPQKDNDTTTPQPANKQKNNTELRVWKITICSSISLQEKREFYWLESLLVKDFEPPTPRPPPMYEHITRGGWRRSSE